MVDMLSQAQEKQQKSRKEDQIVMATALAKAIGDGMAQAVQPLAMAANLLACSVASKLGGAEATQMGGGMSQLGGAGAGAQMGGGMSVGGGLMGMAGATFNIRGGQMGPMVGGSGFNMGGGPIGMMTSLTNIIHDCQGALFQPMCQICQEDGHALPSRYSSAPMCVLPTQ